MIDPTTLRPGDQIVSSDSEPLIADVIAVQPDGILARHTDSGGLVLITLRNFLAWSKLEARFTARQALRFFGAMRGDMPIVLSNDITGDYVYVSDITYDPDSGRIIVHAGDNVEQRAVVEP